MDTLFDRVKSEESRVNRELTDHARTRIINNLDFYYKTKRKSFSELRKKVGDQRMPDYAIKASKAEVGSYSHKRFDNTKEKWRAVFKSIIADSNTIIVFSFIQILSENRVDRKKDPQDELVVQKLSNILETENILWEIHLDQNIEFERIVSEEMQSADRKVRESFESGEFQRSMEAYNEAWRMFSDEDFSYKIPEKLYNSIEEVLREICVEKEGWLDSKELSHRNYLEELSDRDVFYPNKIMRAELEDLMNSMEKFVSKTGKERKNEHNNIDEEFSRLMIHQTAAYLDFIITRYQSGDFRDD